MDFLSSSWVVRARVILAMAVLTGATLFCSYRLWQATRPLSQRTGSDEVSAYELRFARARQFLPKHGLVCYVPDYTSSDLAKKDFFLARYALAPLVLRNTPDCDPLIGDFPPGIPRSDLASRYSVLEDFGQGVLLLKRNERR